MRFTKSLINRVFKIIQCHVCRMQFRTSIVKYFTAPVSVKVAISIWSAGYQRPIEAGTSIQEKNSSNGNYDSAPDHFGTMEIDERSSIDVYSVDESQPLTPRVPHVGVLPPYLAKCLKTGVQNFAGYISCT